LTARCARPLDRVYSTSGTRAETMQTSMWRRVLYSSWARPIILIALLIVLWQLAIVVFRIPPYLIPAPLAVVKQLVTQWPELLQQASFTTYATLGGFALSIAFGIPMALLIAYSRTVESFVYPLLVFSQSVPKVAIAPLFVVWFGFGIIPKVIAAFMLGFFPIVVSTVVGFKSVDRDMIDLARSMKASKLQIFRRISLPQALPSVFAGLKVSVTLAVVGAVVGEFVGSNSGIGYVLQIANGNFDLPLMFAALTILSLIGVLLFAAVDLVERLMIPWHASQRNEFTATA
jgi:NitT/TauT family transport system permease protein